MFAGLHIGRMAAASSRREALMLSLFFVTTGASLVLKGTCTDSDGLLPDSPIHVASGPGLHPHVAGGQLVHGTLPHQASD